MLATPIALCRLPLRVHFAPALVADGSLALLDVTGALLMCKTAILKWAVTRTPSMSRRCPILLLQAVSGF